MPLQHEMLPAAGPYVTDPGSKTQQGWRHPIHWLDPQTEVYYPRVLVSYALWRGEPMEVFEPLRVHGTVFGDSGGYSIVTQGGRKANLDPTDVIRWQVEHCTRGVILDVPPYSAEGSIQFRGSAEDLLNQNLDVTLSNIRRALPIYLNSKSGFKWWGVVQGETLKQMDHWHGSICNLYLFDQEGEGWALAPKPSTDILSCARYMRFAHDNDLRRVHLLQVTAEKTVGVVLALGVMSGRFDLITYDSFSAGRCAVNRSAIIHDGLGMSYIKESRHPDELDTVGLFGWAPGYKHPDGQPHETTVQDYMARDCWCPACKWFRDDFPLTNREYPHYILLHNHIVMQEACERIYRAALDDPERVLRWSCGSKYGQVLREWGKTVPQPKRQSKTPSLLQRVKGL